ncbi:hypothetical protein QR680_005039 [Steinernema hermaphroditum]|uniref:Uncharacterized protein n=1 Tax=Steinernema hermaphroditum TaxID=289476 RepID=A0AA39HRQ7_9BILA|nr:hypothetical protein QR680_005039 [Steinernema hermaphroditum]
MGTGWGAGPWTGVRGAEWHRGKSMVTGSDVFRKDLGGSGGVGSLVFSEGPRKMTVSAQDCSEDDCSESTGRRLLTGLSSEATLEWSLPD